MIAASNVCLITIAASTDRRSPLGRRFRSPVANVAVLNSQLTMHRLCWLLERSLACPGCFLCVR
jgi:hypothetical protein